MADLPALRSIRRVLGHRHRTNAPGQSSDALPAALHPSSLRHGVLRVVVFAIAMVALITALPGLSSVRSQLSHGSPGWLIAAAALRLGSALSYVGLFRAVFDPSMSRRLSYRIGMSEIGTNAFLPAGGVGGLALGGWVLRRRGMPSETVVSRSAQFFVFTSAFNVGSVAVIGWLATAGVLTVDSGIVFKLVPAVAASAAIVLAASLIPRLATLEGRRDRARERSLRWWVLEALVSLGTGAGGAVDLFRERNPRALLSGAGYLFFDIATMWAAVRAFGLAAPVGALALAYLVGQLAGEIPIPGGIGAVDGGLIGAMALYGLPITVVTAGAVAYRAISLGVPAVFGGVAAAELVRSLHAAEL